MRRRACASALRALAAARQSGSALLSGCVDETSKLWGVSRALRVSALPRPRLLPASSSLLPHAARGFGFEAGGYRERHCEPALGSVRTVHRAATPPPQPRAHVGPYAAPRSLPARRSSHGFAGEERGGATTKRVYNSRRKPELSPASDPRSVSSGGAAKRKYVSRPKLKGSPVPVPRSVSSAPPLSGNAESRARQLTYNLKQSESADEVFTLLAPSLAKEPGAVILNGIHVSTACMQLSKLPPSTIAGDTRFVTLLSVSEALLDVMGEWGLANVLYACGKLGTTPSDSWMDAFWRVSLAQMEQFIPQGLSNMLWACGQLNLTPPPYWLERYWTASEGKLASFNAQNFSNTLWACGKLDLPPPAVWLERFWEVSEGELASFIEQNFSNTLYACGQLGITPPTRWMHEFWRASLLKLGQYTSQNLANSLYACGQLALQPEPDWLRRFWEASEGKLASFNEQDFSNTLYASALLRITPPAGWMRDFWRASSPKLGQFTSQNLANSLYACGLLYLQPEPDWLHRFWEISEDKLASFNPQECANSLQAVAILQLWDCPAVGALWTKLNAAVASPSSPDRVMCARQLYQVHQNAHSERPGLLLPPSAEVLEFARDAWVKSANESRDAPSTFLHRSVSECLTAAGIEHENERWCEQSGHSIDIAIESGAHRIALEVDGPSHYLQNGQPDGPTQLRNRLLRAHGRRVAVVNYRRWNALLSQHERIAYLKGLLDAAEK